MKRRSMIRNGGEDERGMALVIALLVLLSLTILGTALMMTVNIEGKIAGHQLRDTQALSIAEAGIEEAKLRIRVGDVPDNMNPRDVTLIYEEQAGSIPVSGPDTTSLPTLQGPDQYLGYSSSQKELAQGSTSDLQVLTVRYKTTIVPGAPPDTFIMRYDDAGNPKLNTTTGTPIFTITSTGRKGNVSRSVVADVTRAVFNIQTRAAIAAEVAIQFQGNIKICGHDHLYATPTWTEPPLCNTGVGAWWTGAVHGNCMPGGWSTSVIDKAGAAEVIGDPTDFEANQAGFYSGPWDAIGLTQAEFWTWVGTSQTSAPNPPTGINYLDNNGTPQDQSGIFTYTGGNGEGFLYVDGDLRINGNFTFKGLIYVEGDLSLNGNSWILGGIIVRGRTVVRVANGSAVVLYSSDAVQQTLAKHGGMMRMISWREF